MARMEFTVGDRVVLATEAEHGGDPARVGVVIDTSAVDVDGHDVVAVDFPWSPSHVVLRAVSLELVERPADPPAPDAVLDAARRLGHAIGQSGMHVLMGDPEQIESQLVQHLAGKPTPVLPPLPEGMDKHAFEGRGTACTMTDCGRDDADPIHQALPPYRLRYLEDIRVGHSMFITGSARWALCTVLDRRDDDVGRSIHLIVVDEDGDHRGLAGPALMTLPVPLDRGPVESG